jgi:AcrR family transcriptional regulator
MATTHDPGSGTLAGQGQRPERQMEKDERQQREERILDAAATLLVRWGYRKTTIDDVAREAGVGKGTIYLHWKDKNELFRAALLREQERFGEDVKQRIVADPEGGLLHCVTAHSMLAALSNPLMAAVLKGNTDIFNGFLRAYDRDLLNQIVGVADAYLAQLQDAGLIRRDIPVPVITFLLTALKVGIINSPDIIGQEHTPSIEQLTEAFSDLVRRWLEPEQLPNTSDVGKQFLAEYLDKVKESEQLPGVERRTSLS